MAYQLSLNSTAHLRALLEMKNRSLSSGQLYESAHCGVLTVIPAPPALGGLIRTMEAFWALLFNAAQCLPMAACSAPCSAMMLHHPSRRNCWACDSEPSKFKRHQVVHNFYAQHIAASVHPAPSSEQQAPDAAGSPPPQPADAVRPPMPGLDEPLLLDCPPAIRYTVLSFIMGFIRYGKYSLSDSD